MGVIVVCLDVAIILSFLASFYILDSFEKMERKEINNNNVTTEDFTVVIKTLPDYESYTSIRELKSRLWNHLESII